MKHPECFISYCWSNSKDAIQKGSRSIQGALGWGDPRNFKNFIEKNSVSCWMDIERVGQVQMTLYISQVNIMLDGHVGQVLSLVNNDYY